MPQLRPNARRRLAELGFLGRRHRRNLTESESVRLRTALEELGPLFGCFGRYLSSRIDLLPQAACSSLAATRIPGAEEVPDEAAPEVSGIDVDPSPFRWTFLHLWHNGVLENGQDVVIKSVRAEMVSALENQIEELPVLERIQLEELGEVGDAVESYLVWLERQFDLRREYHGLRRLAAEVPHFDALVVPRLWEEHSDQDILVCSDPGGSALADVCDLNGDGEQGRDRGRRLCSAWLQQVLLESVLPEGPVDENLLLLDDGRIAVTGGLFTNLGRKSRRSLLDALIATVRGDPDRACDHLLRACDADLSETDHDRLHVLFRQAEPFREGGWGASYHGQRLADSLFVQWRLMRREGIDIPPPVVAYLRGLHQVEGCARRLAPDHDTFADAVDDLGVVAAATQLRESMSVRRMRGLFEAAVPVLRELGESLEKLGAGSDTATDGATSGRDRRRRRWSEIAGLLLLMVATAVSALGLQRAGIGGDWLNVSATALFAVLAILALWRTSRS